MPIIIRKFAPKTSKIMKICIFCSANSQIDPDFFRMTEELGQWMGENGHDVVFGGCDMGLMECVAKAVHEHGGKCYGMVPTKVEENGHVSHYVDVEYPCQNLSDRKDLMLEQSDFIVALPGGVGTLDEIFTVAASATIGYHHKRVVLYNMKGFWDKLVALLDDLQQKGMIRGDWHQLIAVASSLDDLKRVVEEQA